MQFEDSLTPSLVDVRRYGVPDGTKSYTIKGNGFRSVEGFFKPDLWGKDASGLADMVLQSLVQELYVSNCFYIFLLAVAHTGKVH